MPPQPRDYAPGLHHVWVNATGNEPYYVDDTDRIAWVRELVRAIERYDWTCIAFAQVTTHVHLILAIDDWSLPLGMKQLNLAYSKTFNERHARRGQFVRRRYGSRRVDGASDLLGVYAYVVLNPVEAGLCFEPERWHWSSYRTTLGVANDFPFVDASLVLAEFGGSRLRLRNFVTAQRDARLSKKATAGV